MGRKGRPPRSVEDRFWEKVNKNGKVVYPELGKCWEWTASKSRGYGQFRRNRKQEKSHRVAWTLTKGEIPSGLLVLHKCDNPVCVNPEHLFLGTYQDNMDDMVEKGRDVKIAGEFGETHHSAKLTEEDVLEIRNLKKKGVKAKVLAEHYGVHQVTISSIVRKHTWKHI